VLADSANTAKPARIHMRLEVDFIKTPLF